MELEAPESQGALESSAEEPEPACRARAGPAWRRPRFSGPLGKVASVATLMGASFACGHFQGKRQHIAQPGFSGQEGSFSSKAIPLVGESRKLGFVVPGEFGDELMDMVELPANMTRSIADEAEGPEAPPRRLALDISLPLPMHIRPPDFLWRRKKDNRLMAGSISMKDEDLATKHSRWFNSLGCFRLSPHDKQRMEDGSKMVFMDKRCVLAEGASESNPCASGLPFFRKIMQERMSSTDCMRFCISKGLDIFGIVWNQAVEEKLSPMTDAAAWECRCGAGRRNQAVWGQDKFPDPKKFLNFQDKVPYYHPECKMLVWQYSGKMENHCVPYQFIRLSEMDTKYVHSIGSGDPKWGEDDEETFEPQVFLDRDFNVEKFTPESSGPRRFSAPKSATGRRLGVCEDVSQTAFTNNFGGRLTCGEVLSRGLCRRADEFGTIARSDCPVTCGTCTRGSWLSCYPGKCAGGAPWPNKASNGLVYIPYFFDSTVIWESTKEAFRMAAAEWARVTCVNFVEQAADNGQPRIRVINPRDNSCNAVVGFSTASDVYLGRCHTAADVGLIMHEMGHLLGMNHEQDRPDGTQSFRGGDGVTYGPYLRMNWASVPESIRPLWTARPDSYVGSDFQGYSHANGRDIHWGWAPYDFYSLMHYGPYDRSLTPIFTTGDLLVDNMIGMALAISDQDARDVADMYQCTNPNEPNWRSPPGAPPPVVSPPSPLPTAAPTPSRPPTVIITNPFANLFSAIAQGISNFFQAIGNAFSGLFGGSSAGIGSGGNSNCVDTNPPGWQCNGGACTCPSLRSYCTNSIYSPDITKYCQATCGTCAGARAPCRDIAPEGWNCNGRECSCQELSGYCNDPVYGPTVRGSCKSVCGEC